MNNWGAVKLGMLVAAAGTLGVLRSAKGASPRNIGIAQGIISGAAGEFESLQRASNNVSSDFDKAGGPAASPLDQAASRNLAAKAAYGGLSRGGFDAGRMRAGAVPEGAVRKLVRTASVCFEVKDQIRARALVRAVIFRNGAEIFAEDSSGDGDNASGVIVIQAPPERLEDILHELEPMGKIVSRSISTQNLSEEYVDLKSRLEKARKVEKRVTELMDFKTNRLPEILQLEHEIERVDAEIEQTIGRMKYIDTLAATSRITVRMAQPAVLAKSPTPEAPGVLTEIRNSLVGSLTTFVHTGLSLLNLTGFVLAIGLWTLPVVGLLWMLQKKFQS